MIDLNEVANARGYGTGRAVRDRLAAEAECRALLPDPHYMPSVEARGDDGGHLIPMAHFGNSSDDGKDWALFQEYTECELSELGQDARDDARIVAAIINAYRLGVLVLAGEESK